MSTDPNMTSVEDCGPAFTPGPWHGDYVRILCAKPSGDDKADTKNLVALVYSCRDGELNKNRNLIAASPELYEALELCIGDLETFHVSCTCRPPITEHERTNLARAKAALAKARGEKP